MEQNFHLKEIYGEDHALTEPFIQKVNSTKEENVL